MRFALGLEYFGSGFCGWQSQPNGCGIQDAVQSALSKIAKHEVTVVAAGRTDTGVHAAEQVIHFDTTAERPIGAWVRGPNTSLPQGVAVLWAQPVPSEFHARFSAWARCYTYVLLNRSSRPGINHGRVGWYHRPLDECAMAGAAQCLIGRHDFSAFRSSECQAKTPIKTLHELRIERRGEYMAFHFCADAFLHHMVRNLVGSLVYVGYGRYPAQWIENLMASKDRSLAAPTFMPHGLYLTRIEYNAGWQLPQRENSTQANWLQDLALTL